MFELLMNCRLPEPTATELDRLDAVSDAEDALTGIIRHVARTSFSHDDVVGLQLALSAILVSFARVEQMRSEVK